MKTKRIAIIMLCAVLCVIMGGEKILSALFIPTSAAEVGSFDNTSIEDDLGADTIKLYPKTGYGDCEIIHVLEYAYSEHLSYQQFYNVYLYVYNPTGKPISMLNEGYNLVSMVTGFGENGDDKEINTVDLEFVKKTSDNLIYKFKLSSKWLKQIYAYQQEYAAAHKDARRYEFVKLQVKHASGLTQTKEFSKTYEFTGYSAYCDKDKSPESTLQCKDFVNSTIELQLRHTNYRAEEQKNGMQDELNSVYFSVPNRYYQDKETLYGVSAEWYEYKTKPIYVTSDSGAYSGLWSVLNVYVDDRGRPTDANGNVLDPEGWEKCDWRVLWSAKQVGSVHYFGCSYAPYASSDIDDDGIFDAGMLGDGSSNLALGSPNGYTIDPWTYETKIDWLIKVNDTWSDNAYKVPAEKVEEYMKLYTQFFPNQTKIRDKYASGLFLPIIDADRIKLLEDPSQGSGKISKRYTSDVLGSFITVDQSQSAWNEFWFGEKYVDKPYSPIVQISYADIEIPVNDFSDKYYVSKADAASIQSYAKESYSKNETPIILRFAVTDYYSSEAYFDDASDGKFPFYDKVFGTIEGNGYIAQETMFLDFNVIELEFKDENGVIRSVGAVAEPIDIINGLTPPDSLVEDEEWYQKLIALILVIIVLMVVYFLINTYVPFLGMIIRWVLGAFWWLFKSLFMLITWPMRALLSSAGKTIKRKLKIRSPRGRKRRRGRPKKKRSLKEKILIAKTVASELSEEFRNKNQNKKE